jgi:hypothetical protein
MAAPPPRYIAPADVQGTPLARLLIGHPDVAGAVFSCLTYADARPLRAACRGFRGAVAEHPWELPLPLPIWLTDPRYSAAVDTPAGLARWRAAFPAGRTLALADTYRASDMLRDADVAPAVGWGLTGVHVYGVYTLTRAGLAALCGPALKALYLTDTPQLSGADVAAATAASPRLHALDLHALGPLADADLAGWGGVHVLTVRTRDVRGFSWDGVRHLSAVRELTLPLLPQAVSWAGDALRGLVHLTRLCLQNNFASADLPNVIGPAGLFAPGSLPRSLRHVTLLGLQLEWPPGVQPDGGAALLRPLAGVPDVALVACDGVGDGGLCALAGTTRLVMEQCLGVAGERLEALGGALEELTVKFSDRFTGGGLGSLAALRRLTVEWCPAFQSGALGAIAAGCAALERVAVGWRDYAPSFDAAAAEAALLAAAAAGGGGGGGGGVGSAWTFTRGDRTWAATRHPQHAALAPAPAAGVDGGLPAAAPATTPAAGATTGGTGDDRAAPEAAASLSDDAPPPPPPARRQRVGE